MLVVLETMSPEEVLESSGLHLLSKAELLGELEKGALEIKKAYEFKHINGGVAAYFAKGRDFAPIAYAIFDKLTKLGQEPRISAYIAGNRREATGCFPDTVLFWADPDAIVELYEALKKDGYYNWKTTPNCDVELDPESLLYRNKVWNGFMAGLDIQTNEETTTKSLLDLLKEGVDLMEIARADNKLVDHYEKYAPVACLLNYRLNPRMSPWIAIHLRAESRSDPNEIEFWSYIPAINELYDALVEEGHYGKI